MQKKSVAQALTEVKRNESRFAKSLTELKVIAVKRDGKLLSPNTHISEEDFVKNAKSSVQSSLDILQNTIDMKVAIEKSNHNAKITVCGKDMTIQEALILERYMPLKKEFLKVLKSLYKDAIVSYERATQENNERAEKMIADSLSKDATHDQKLEVFNAVEEIMKKTSTLEMVDPCELEKLIKDLENEIEEFETNIDFAKTTCNSLTEIEY